MLQALSVDPINAHVLELLNIALESSTLIGPRVGGAEFKKQMRALQEKWTRNRAISKKGKDKEREDVEAVAGTGVVGRSDVGGSGDADVGDEMSVG